MIAAANRSTTSTSKLLSADRDHTETQRSKTGPKGIVRRPMYIEKAHGNVSFFPSHVAPRKFQAIHCCINVGREAPGCPPRPTPDYLLAGDSESSRFPTISSISLWASGSTGLTVRSCRAAAIASMSGRSFMNLSATTRPYSASILGPSTSVSSSEALYTACRTPRARHAIWSTDALSLGLGPASQS